jgi:hypothetical protein
MIVKETAVAKQPKEIDVCYPAEATPYDSECGCKITVPYAAEFNPSSFTAEMWVKYQGGTGYRSVVTSVSGSAWQGRLGYVLCVNQVGQWQFWLGNGQMRHPWMVVTGPKAKVGVWTHLAGTYDRASRIMTLYVNGQAVGQRTGALFSPNSCNPLHVGAGAVEQAGASHCLFRGQITKVRLWSRPLAQRELEALASEGEPDDTAVLTLDGRGDYAEVPHSPALNPTQFTVSCWANVQGEQGRWRSIVTSREGSPIKGYSLYAGENNHWQFLLGTGKNEWVSLNGPELALNTWTFLTGTYDGKIMKFYVNGEFVGEKVVNDFAVNEKYPLRIGAGATEGNPTHFFPGQITDVRVWNIASSQREIQNQMNYRLIGLEAGLAGYWPLNEGSGGAIKDKTPYGHHGTIANYVEVPYFPILNLRQFTVSCWVNADNWQGSARTAVASCDDFLPKGYILCAGEDNKWKFMLGSGDAGWSAIGGEEVKLNQRTFLAGTCDGSVMKFYINGELAAEKTIYYAPNTEDILRIGAGIKEGKVANFFPGQITDVRIWNRACSLEEIKKEMNNLAMGEAPGLVGYWPLKEATGMTVPDRTSYGHDGAINTSSWESLVGLVMIKNQSNGHLNGRY